VITNLKLIIERLEAQSIQHWRARHILRRRGREPSSKDATNRREGHGPSRTESHHLQNKQAR
jgi:hypothetical protein